MLMLRMYMNHLSRKLLLT
uniref:Uncharacterized protein n=1 Tax=Rhizophora mucronata TaxID=61149 RepID=A0A2P2NX30_RHIMU